MGVDLGTSGVAFRCNLVTLEHNNGHPVMRDFTAGHIESEEAAAIIETLEERLGDQRLRFHPGVSYRHLLVWQDGPCKAATTPPHDISDQAVTDPPSQRRGWRRCSSAHRSGPRRA